MELYALRPYEAAMGFPVVLRGASPPSRATGETQVRGAFHARLARWAPRPAPVQKSGLWCDTNSVTQGLSAPVASVPLAYTRRGHLFLLTISPCYRYTAAADRHRRYSYLRTTPCLLAWPAKEGFGGAPSPLRMPATKGRSPLYESCGELSSSLCFIPCIFPCRGVDDRGARLTGKVESRTGL